MRYCKTVRRWTADETAFPPPASCEAINRVHVIATQYFGGIPPHVWFFRVGGYQVCEKWLKARKGHTLDYADIQHYQKIVVALGETIRLMASIDQTIVLRGGWQEAFYVSSANQGEANA